MMPNDCFGPLGGGLAFIGAGGIIAALFTFLLIIPTYDYRKEPLDSFSLTTVWLGPVVLSLCVILGIINQAYLPGVCYEQGQSRPSQPWLIGAYIALFPWVIGSMVFFVELDRRMGKPTP